MTKIYKKYYRSLCITLALTFLLAATALAQVGGIAPRFLIDPVSPAAAAQVAPNDEGQSKFQLGKDGISVTIAGGPAG